MARTRKVIRNLQNGDNSSKCKSNLCIVWKFIKDCLYNIFVPLTRITDVGYFTAILVFVAILQWNTLEKTDETLKSQQRAWIEPRAPSITSGRARGETLNFTVRYANIGNEPAVNAVIQTDVRPIEVTTAGDQARGWFPRKNDMCKHSHPNDAGLVVWQSDSKTHELFYTSSDSPPDAEDVWNGLKFLVVEGCIGYETVGSVHYSAFCYYTRPIANKPSEEWPLQLCMNHNTAD